LSTADLPINLKAVTYKAAGDDDDNRENLSLEGFSQKNPNQPPSAAAAA